MVNLCRRQAYDPMRPASGAQVISNSRAKNPLFPWATANDIKRSRRFNQLLLRRKVSKSASLFHKNTRWNKRKAVDEFSKLSSVSNSWKGEWKPPQLWKRSILLLSLLFLLHWSMTLPCDFVFIWRSGWTLVPNINTLISGY